MTAAALTTSSDNRQSLESALPAPLLLTASHAAALCGKSVRVWRSWDSSGKVPRPIHVGRSTLWRADELRAWIEARCPTREQWEARQTRLRR